MIKCPECSAPDSIFFEGVCAVPVISEDEGDGVLRHAWDWEYAEMVDERGYFCRECDASYLDPESFVIQKEVTSG